MTQRQLLVKAFSLLVQPVHVEPGLDEWQRRCGLMRVRMLEAARFLQQAAQVMRYDLNNGYINNVKEALMLPTHEINVIEEARNEAIAAQE